MPVLLIVFLLMFFAVLFFYQQLVVQHKATITSAEIAHSWKDGNHSLYSQLLQATLVQKQLPLPLDVLAAEEVASGKEQVIARLISAAQRLPSMISGRRRNVGETDKS